MQSSQRSVRRLATAASGGLVLAAALALSLPGVNAVRADEAGSVAGSAGAGAAPSAARPVLPVLPVGPMCQAGAVPDSALVARVLAAARERALAANLEARGEVVPLNTRGYNYGSQPLQADLAAIFREASLGGAARR